LYGGRENSRDDSETKGRHPYPGWALKSPSPIETVEGIPPGRGFG